MKCLIDRAPLLFAPGSRICPCRETCPTGSNSRFAQALRRRVFPPSSFWASKPQRSPPSISWPRLVGNAALPLTLASFVHMLKPTPCEVLHFGQVQSAARTSPAAWRWFRKILQRHLLPALVGSQLPLRCG